MRSRALHLLVPLSVALTVVVPAVGAQASTASEALPAVQAQMSDTVVEGLGVNIHLLYGGTRYADFPAVQAALDDLGVRHVRDSLGNARSDQYAKTNALAAAGVRTTFTVDRTTDVAALPARLDTIARNMSGAVESVEPPNEYNNAGVTTWAADLQAYQPELYRQVRSRPALDGVTVLGPALARRQGYTEVGDLSAHLDAGNVHTYPGGFVPTRNLDLQLANQSIIAGSKPVVVTEAGYHDAMATASTHYATPEAVAGTYLPRLMLEYHQRGVRSYLYELFEQNPEPAYADKESHFGLVRADGTTKPAYDALRNLVRLTADPGESFTPGALGYTATTPAPGLKQTLLQRRDGTFVLLLWRDVAIWDPITKTHLAPAPAPVTVQLRDAATVVTHRPSRSGDAQSVADDAHDLTVDVGADVTALVIAPPAVTPHAEPVATEPVVTEPVVTEPVVTEPFVIEPVVTAPVTAPDTVVLDEDTTLVQPAAGVLVNDLPGSGGAPEAQLVDAPDHGTVSLQSDGSFVYAPEPDYAGADSFTYLAKDADSAGTPADVAVTVNAVNDAPVAADDSYGLDEDTTFEASASAGVLANDTDMDMAGGDSVTALLSIQPQHGSVVLQPDGSFSYIPDSDYAGTDAFGYLAVDAAGATTGGHVTLSVGATNDAPVAADVRFATAEDTGLHVPAETGLAAAAYDADADALTAVVVSRPQAGTVTVGADGSLDYLPHADAWGDDTFTYQLGDGVALSRVATATVHVTPANDLPVAVPDTYRTLEGQRLVVPASGVMGNDTDADGDALSAALRVGPAHGTVLLRLDGSFVYTPHPDWSGTDGFDYRVNDGSGVSRLAHVSVHVAPVNDAPVNVLPSTLSTYRGTALTLSAVKGTGVAVTDVDAGPSMQVSVTTTYGATTLRTRNGLTFLRGDGVGDSSMVFRGTLAAVNAALDGATFRPKSGFVGTASLTLVSDDRSGTTTARDTDVRRITVR